MKNYKQLIIWQKGIDIVIKSFNLVKTFPIEAKAGFSSQITRAAVSIPSNIAEGSSRTSTREYGRYIEISLGSTFELETHLLIAKKMNFGDVALADLILSDLDEEQKMLMSFKHKLDT